MSKLLIPARKSSTDTIIGCILQHSRSSSSVSPLPSTRCRNSPEHSITITGTGTYSIHIGWPPWVSSLSSSTSSTSLCLPSSSATPMPCVLVEDISTILNWDKPTVPHKRIDMNIQYQSKSGMGWPNGYYHRFGRISGGWGILRGWTCRLFWVIIWF